MLSWISLWLVYAALFMAAVKGRNGRDSRNKFWAFVLVSVFVGVITIYKAYYWVGYHCHDNPKDCDVVDL